MAFEDQVPDFTLKLILIGDPSVGKTSLLQQYLHSTFPTTQQATIGVGYGSKTLMALGRILRMQLWDTVLAYAGGTGGISVHHKSYDSVTRWVNELRESSSPVLALVGNMSDLDSRREVSTDDGKRLAHSLGVEFFYEVSAKTGDNVMLAFNKLAEEALSNFLATQKMPSRTSFTSILTKNTQVSQATRTGCCK